MIEKAFEKSYSIPMAKQTLTRLAKRFIADYKKASGTSSDEYLQVATPHCLKKRVGLQK